MSTDETASLVRSSSDDLIGRPVYIRSIRPESREIDFVFSTAAIDAYGERVEQVWRLDRYIKNPVVLYAHCSRDLPIGRAKNVGVIDGELQGTVVIASAKANPLAENVWQSCQEGTLRAGSVGFLSHSIRWETENDVEFAVLSDNELLEFSITPIPANEDALAKAKQRALAIWRDAKSERERGAVPYRPETPVDTDSWDAAAAETRVRKWASSDGSGDKSTIDWSKYKRAFAWFDQSAPEAFGSFKLPHHDVDRGVLDTVRAGVVAAGNACMGGRGGVAIPADDIDGVKAHLAKHYRQFDMMPPWEQPSEGKSASADTTKTSPPAERGGHQGETKMDEKEAAALKSKVAEFEKTVSDLSRNLEVAQTKASTLETQNARLVTERDAEKAAREKVEGELVEHEVGTLIGHKIYSNEKDLFVRLRKTDRNLFDAMIAQRSPMTHLQPVIGELKDGAMPEPVTGVVDSEKLLAEFSKSL